MQRLLSLVGAASHTSSKLKTRSHSQFIFYHFINVAGNADLNKVTDTFKKNPFCHIQAPWVSIIL